MAILSDDEERIKEKPRKNPVIKAETIAYDRVFENSIRPKSFDTYVGQTALKETLKISIEAAKKRNTTLDHVLFYGPPGLGKTTLAGIIAEELGTSVKITSAPSFERPRDIIGVLMSLKEGEVLFIDEIHRLNTVTEEILYPAMEDFYLDMMTGKTQTVKTMRIKLPKFTLVGATTKAGGISSPLRDRFGFVHRLQFYSVDELTQVILKTAKILNIEVTKDSAKEIAKRSRGTPRIANRLLKRVGDFAIVKNEGKVDLSLTNESLSVLKIDEYGLDETDRNMLMFIIEKYNGGPVGLDTIAAALGEDVRTIEDVCEPYLLQAGLLVRTPRGRKVSPEAYRHFGLKEV